MFAGDYARAAEQIDRGLELNPNHSPLLHNRGELLLAQRLDEAAIDPLERSVELSRERSAHYVAMLGSAYARAGRRTEARAILDELTARAGKGRVSAFDMAHLYRLHGPVRAGGTRAGRRAERVRRSALAVRAAHRARIGPGAAERRVQSRDVGDRGQPGRRRVRGRVHR